MSAATTYAKPQDRDQHGFVDGLHGANDGLCRVVEAGAPPTRSAKDAAELIDIVERARRFAVVAAVDVLAQIETTRSFYEHGHANSRVMFEHVAGVSGAEAHRLDKIRRMTAGAGKIAKVWRRGDLSVDKAALLARAYANPRTRARFLIDRCGC